jgi:taurine dioxygenase
LSYQVIFFRNQKFEPSSQKAFAQRIGKPIIYPFVKSLENFPEITPILKKETDINNFGGIWHSDTTYQEKPPMGTMLYGIEIPQYGGDTEWSNQYLAYESLSQGMKKFLDTLQGVNISGKARVAKTRSDIMKHASVGLKGDELKAIHPVVRTHPETKRKSLYVNEAHTTNFVGMTEEESLPILEFLFKHQIKSEFTCRFRWKPGSVAIWDNRCTMHNPINDYHGQRRLMHRITFAGDKPV